MRPILTYTVRQRSSWRLLEVAVGRRRRDRQWALAERQAWRCAWCQGLMVEEEGAARVTLEHIVPRHAGGENGDANLVAACSACNKGRGESASVNGFSRFRAKLVLNGRWPPCASPTPRVLRLLNKFRRSMPRSTKSA